MTRRKSETQIGCPQNRRIEDAKNIRKRFLVNDANTFLEHLFSLKSHFNTSSNVHKFLMKLLIFKYESNKALTILNIKYYTKIVVGDGDIINHF